MASLYQAFVEIVPEAKNLRKTLAREFDAAGPEAGRAAGKGINSGVLGSVGKLAGPLVAAFAAIGIGNLIGDAVSSGVQFAMDGIKNASDLSETRSAIGTLFGDAAKDIEKFASSAVKDLGQTQQEALSAAQTFGIFAKSAGLGGEDLAGFSTELVTLSADLASFFNTDSQTAIDAIGAGLRGESEPLRQFGVLLDDATLKSRAMALGIFDGTGALTQQQRVLAAQAEILAQTSLAQGDVQRTSGGLAFQQKQLAAAFEGAKTSLGTALLPAMTSLITLANDQLVPILNDLVEEIGPILADALKQSAPAFGELIVALAPLIPDLVKLAIQVLPAVTKILILLAPLLIDIAANTTSVFNSFNALTSFLSGDTTFAQLLKTITNLGGSFGVASGMVSSFMNTVISTLSNLGRSIGTGTLFNSGRDLIQGFINGIKAMLGPVAKAVGGVMDFVGGFFPNSPADRGQFSGSGWTKLKKSGEAIGDQFGAGLDAATATLSLGSTLALPAGPRFDSSVYGSASYAANLGGAPARNGDTYKIYEAVSPVATAMEVARRQNAFGAV